MNKNNLNEAIGYVDDTYLEIAEERLFVKDKVAHFKHTSTRRMPALIAAVILVMACTVGAFAVGLFSPINGDNFTMDSVYEGNGIVAITIENKSDKDLNLSPETKLMKFYANEEVQKIGDVSFSNTLIKAHETASVNLDLSKAYDINTLEKPLNDDYYYLILTNNSFLFGYDWHCYVAFAETETKTPEYVETALNLPVDEQTGILTGLEKYFYTFDIGVEERNAKVCNYYADCNKLLADVRKTGANIISPVNPLLFVGKPDENIVFDDRVPMGIQYQLIGEHHYVLDAYNIPVGESDLDSALVLSTYVGQTARDIKTTGGCEIPLIYIFQYAKDDIKSNNDYAFIRGRLLTFEELDPYKVYEDDEYVCFEVTDLFYTNLDEHLDIMINSRSDIYVDDGMRTRVHNVYDFLKNESNLTNLFYYHNENSNDLKQGITSFFGGSYTDSNGKFVVVLTDITTENRTAICKELGINESTTVFEVGAYTLEYLTELQSRISSAMTNKELPFVTSSIVDEFCNRIKVRVTTDNEIDLEKVLTLDTIGGAIVIERSAGATLEDLAVAK